MAEELCAAAVALDAEVVERFLSLSFLGFLAVLVPEVAYRLSTAEASDGDDHG